MGLRLPAGGVPTDFHTATLLDEDDTSVPTSSRNCILVVGGLGYENERSFWHTPVYRLDLEWLSIQPFEATGDAPGWIYKHCATLLPEGKLLITGVNILDEHGKFQPNGHRFELNLWDRKWFRTS